MTTLEKLLSKNGIDQTVKPDNDERISKIEEALEALLNGEVDDGE